MSCRRIERANTGHSGVAYRMMRGVGLCLSSDAGKRQYGAKGQELGALPVRAGLINVCSSESESPVTLMWYHSKLRRLLRIDDWLERAEGMPSRLAAGARLDSYTALVGAAGEEHQEHLDQRAMTLRTSMRTCTYTGKGAID